MKPNLYLHIGLPKTGTSSIQDFFAQNESLIKPAGLLYPQLGREGTAHFDLSTALGFKLGIRYKADPKSLIKFKADLVSECSKANPKSVIISSENFSLPGPTSEVQSFFDGFNVKIVVYLRRHDFWWESKYWQATRMVSNPRWARGFESYVEFLEEQKHLGASFIRYKFVVDRWAETFGPENVIVRPYEEEQTPGGSVADILRVLGQEALALDETVVGATNSNKSRSFLCLQLIEVYQRLDIPSKLKQKLVKHALSVSLVKEETRLSSPEFRLKVFRENQPDYEYIARKFLHRDDGRLFQQEPIWDGSEWLDPAPLLNLTAIKQTLMASGYV